MWATAAGAYWPNQSDSTACSSFVNSPSWSMRKTVGNGSHKTPSMGSFRTRIWRAGDLLLPLRATSSYHRCRSKAGWRDRQVLSGCNITSSISAGLVNEGDPDAFLRADLTGVPAPGPKYRGLTHLSRTG